MDTSAKIFVAGHRGLVGSALKRNLQSKGYNNLLVRTHAELDLTDQKAVEQFFQQEKPNYVFLAAAKVGGIHANNTYPAEFIRDNLAIQSRPTSFMPRMKTRLNACRRDGTFRLWQLRYRRMACREHGFNGNLSAFRCPLRPFFYSISIQQKSSWAMLVLFLSDFCLPAWGS